MEYVRTFTASDSGLALGQIKAPFTRRTVAYMQSAKPDARWRDAVPLTVSLWSFVLLIFLPVIFSRYADQDWTSILLDNSTFIPCILIGLVIFAIFRASIDWSAPWRIAVLAISVLAAAILQSLYDFAFSAWLNHNLQLDLGGLRMTPPYEKIFRYLLVFLVNLALFQLAAGRRGAQRSTRQLLDARSAAQHAQLEALRYQLNPHFLFNTLNSISSLIVTRRNEDAEEMTNKLSSFLRSSLSSDPAALTPLDDELALIEEYLSIEDVRFGERLNVEIECDSNAGSVLVPGFLVQPLVENAIKHGVAPSREPVTIRIGATLEDNLLCIVVENDRHQDSQPTLGGTGVGLLNVRQRLEAVYGKSASLVTEPDNKLFRATICIPGAKSGR
jgi:sensor histidine kinase YesM